jgi:hypothetical protein
MDFDASYFNSGTMKHIISQHKMSTSLETMLTGNSLYPVNGVRILSHSCTPKKRDLCQFLFLLKLAWWSNSLMTGVLLMIFLLVTVFRTLYKVNTYSKSVGDDVSTIAGSQAVSDTKLWHAGFCHLNFANLLQFQIF